MGEILIGYVYWLVSFIATAVSAAFIYLVLVALVNLSNTQQGGRK